MHYIHKTTTLFSFSAFTEPRTHIIWINTLGKKVQTALQSAYFPFSDTDFMICHIFVGIFTNLRINRRNQSSWALCVRFVQLFVRMKFNVATQQKHKQTLMELTAILLQFVPLKGCRSGTPYKRLEKSLLLVCLRMQISLVIHNSILNMSALHICTFKSTFACMCSGCPRKICHLNASMSCQAVNGWFGVCGELLNRTTSVSYMFMTLTAEAAARGGHNGDKQTGLQGDTETETNAFIMRRLAGWTGWWMSQEPGRAH